ncbi:MAG: single-stranded-DNA-specific exonuclease RecJ [Deltaproteobacteria bacterium]|jgi:single-stranded-DNA-specific exonuclease|nr:single-stranded-DNA-specific exonuclease RecJ [Deltaproteobacteria bacterium]
MIWNFRKPQEREEVRQLARSLGKPMKYAQFLLGRGLNNLDAIEDFTKSNLKTLPLPETMPGMIKAVKLFLDARQTGKLVAISGDYDVDGLTATAVLTRILNSLDFKVTSHIPNRLEDGYGLSSQAVEELHQKGAGLLVTVDCGVSDFEAILTANRLGLPVVITDHHEIPPILPPADAIINPHLGGGWESYPLAGVGVAFMLAWAILRALQLKGLYPQLDPPLVDNLALVALGTIADMSPMIGTNRTMVRHGLKFLSRSTSPSLAALKAAAKLDEGRLLSTRDVGFQLAPKINAAGRMGSASPALELLTTDDFDRAKVLANRLEEINRNRFERQLKLVETAMELLEDSDPQSRTVVLAGENWPRGLLGLVASRVAEEVHKPTVLFTIEGDIVVGSGRSVKGFNLYSALDDTRHLCLSLGGHSEAAGLKLKYENLELFKEAFEISATKQPQVSEEEVLVDLTLCFNELNVLHRYFQELEPFGQGNPAPIALIKNLRVTDAFPTRSSGDKHILFRFSDGTQTQSFMGYNMGKKIDSLAPYLDILLTFDNNRFNPKLPGWKLLDFKPSASNL